MGSQSFSIHKWGKRLRITTELFKMGLRKINNRENFSMSKKSVAVLMGGWSSEREVSLSSGKGVVETLKSRGHTVNPIDVTDNIQDLLEKLSPKPDVVFNALHGTGGEDGVIQGVLDMLKIPYTHSGVTASALAMNKVLAKKIFSFEGIPTPHWSVVNRHSLKTQSPFPLPVVVKPMCDGSSRGVYIVKESFPEEIFASDWAFGEDVLVEPFLEGREISVGVVGDRAVGTLELRYNTEFYDYTAKYTDGVTEHIVPASLSAEDTKIVCDLALRAHKALGCRAASRSDFMYHKGKFYLLEVNTQPGLTPLSLLPDIAAHDGMPFGELLEFLLDHAACRT